jgi:DNA-binding transcriptional LysR family regulator
MNWDDLRIFLRVAGCRSMSAASDELKLSVSTIARRLEALEKALGAVMIKRTPRGVILTEQGAALLDRTHGLQEHVAELERLAATFRNRNRVEVVRITVTEPVIADVLAPNLGRLLSAHPPMRVELMLESDVAALDASDLTVAVRFSRPSGPDLTTKRPSPLIMGLYGARGYLASISSRGAVDLTASRIVSYDNSYGQTPERQWIDRAGLASRICIRTSNTRGIIEAVAAGAGLAVLPKILAADRNLQEVDVGELPPLPSREPWLVLHRNAKRKPAIRAVFRWIEQVFEESESKALQADSA